MELTVEIGKTYLTQEGKVVRIIEWGKVDEADKLNFLGDNTIWYPANGLPFVANSSIGRFNLVEEI